MVRFICIIFFFSLTYFKSGMRKLFAVTFLFFKTTISLLAAGKKQSGLRINGLL